jgi:hypothetical protein
MTNQSCLSASRLAENRRAIAIPSSRGMLKRARLASPSPVHRVRSCIEYFDAKIAWVIRAILGSATVPLSEALLGVKPQQIVARTAASKSGRYSRSKGQFRKTEVAGSRLNAPAPKCSRIRFAGTSLFFLAGFQLQGGTFNLVKANLEGLVRLHFLFPLRNAAPNPQSGSTYHIVNLVNPGGFGCVRLQLNGYPVLQKRRRNGVSDQNRDDALLWIGPRALQSTLPFSILPLSNMILGPNYYDKVLGVIQGALELVSPPLARPDALEVRPGRNPFCSKDSDSLSAQGLASVEYEMNTSDIAVLTISAS